ncbi:calcineurin-like phosphoesterase family protein [Natranaerovirga pectinivora]|uniref:Calcineurin-like phosphoesterase family protein n=1 Tax=Natranaerovirga pectinivora TaxID=682400 RepID=A0A4R3MMY5_9FIRM|nr:metallophosphoesterase [Natranaerovirga pectinivora]TCT14532.1 calcineurin-like phosphoesterase family protein [Natranaerovirga pectinivora]
MILITGDIHGSIDVGKLTTKRFSLQKELTKKDYLIICGDFGGVWFGEQKDRFWLDWHNNKNYTTLFIDGNHENHNLLNEYPIEQWKGGKVHKIRPSVYHLMRGQIFTIEGKKFFAFGGALSTDKKDRRENISWWASEEASIEEIKEAKENLQREDNIIDYVITHTVSKGFRENYLNGLRDEVCEESVTEEFLQYIENNVNYKYWYSGHFHIDKNFQDEKHYVLYNDIISI